jgi:hypothetical protein
MINHLKYDILQSSRDNPEGNNFVENCSYSSHSSVQIEDHQTSKQPKNMESFSIMTPLVDSLIEAPLEPSQNHTFYGILLMTL